MRRPYSTQGDIEKALLRVTLSDGAEYRSGTSVRDFNSRGVCNRVKDLRTGRVRDLFSNGEYWFQEYVAFDNRIIHAEEQWPILPISETVAIAAELGVDHPGASRGVNKEVRTDMRIALRPAPRARIQEIVIEVKDSPHHYEGPKGERALEKRRIVEVWCQAHDKRFLVLYKTAIPRDLLKNLQWLRYGQHRSKLHIGRDKLVLFAKVFRSNWTCDSKATLDMLASKTAEHLAIDRDTSLCAFQRCVWERLLRVDLRKLILPCNPLFETADPNMGVVYPW